MTRSDHWEYRREPADTADLDELGRQGWELVASAGGDSGATLFFKRPALDFRERVTLDQKRRYYALWGLPLSGESGEEGTDA